MLGAKLNDTHREGSRKQGQRGNQVNVLDEREKAGEEARKDIGGLSNAMRTIRCCVMSDDVELAWTLVTKRPQIKKESRFFEFMQIMMSGPLSCRRVRDPEGQLQRDGLNESRTSWKSRPEHHEGLSEFKIRDGLSNVEKGCVENISNIEINVDTGERWRASRRLKQPLILVHHVACSHEVGAMKFQSDRVP